MTISGCFGNVFSTLTLKHYFRKTKSFFKKLEYRFLVESSKIESASFPYKTAASEANVKTNRMVSTKWTYHKERSFTSNYFTLFKLCFNLRISYKDLIWCTNKPASAVVLFGVAFSVRILEVSSPSPLYRDSYRVLIATYIDHWVPRMLFV